MEDTVEDLYERFHVEERRESFQYRVLQEHLETEILSDERLTARLEMDLMQKDVSPGTHVEYQQQDQNSFSSPDSVRDLRLHPVYKKAKEWMQMIQPVGMRRYEQGSRGSQTFFSAYCNSLFAVLKVFTGLEEEVEEDVAGLEIALEEYRLASVYIGRVLESLNGVSFGYEDIDWVEGVIQKGFTLSRDVALLMKSVQDRKQRLL